MSTIFCDKFQFFSLYHSFFLWQFFMTIFNSFPYIIWFSILFPIFSLFSWWFPILFPIFPWRFFMTIFDSFLYIIRFPIFSPMSYYFFLWRFSWPFSIFFSMGTSVCQSKEIKMAKNCNDVCVRSDSTNIITNRIEENVMNIRTNIRLSLIHIWRCRRSTLCRSRWSPYH